MHSTCYVCQAKGMINQIVQQTGDQSFLI